MKNQLFKIGAIAAAVSSILTPAAVFAQETANQQSSEDIEVISVTGIRGALARSQAEKMSSPSIVESISAEDIGKLPDTSIAESLARLPGLSGERVRHWPGQQSRPPTPPPEFRRCCREYVFGRRLRWSAAARGVLGFQGSCRIVDQGHGRGLPP